MLHVAVLRAVVSASRRTRVCLRGRVVTLDYLASRRWCRGILRTVAKVRRDSWHSRRCILFWVRVVTQCQGRSAHWRSSASMVVFWHSAYGTECHLLSIARAFRRPDLAGFRRHLQTTRSFRRLFNASSLPTSMPALNRRHRQLLHLSLHKPRATENDHQLRANNRGHPRRTDNAGFPVCTNRFRYRRRPLVMNRSDIMISNRNQTPAVKLPTADVDRAGSYSFLDKMATRP